MNPAKHGIGREVQLEAHPHPGPIPQVSVAVRASLCLLSLLLLSTSAYAQDYSIDWFTLDGGGGTSAGGGYSLRGTIGQPDASGPMTGGQYSVTGGFWPGAEDSLQLVYAPQGVSLILFWRGTGIMLQQADSPSGSWQDFSPGTASDGVNFQLTVPMTAAKRFYRLRR